MSAAVADDVRELALERLTREVEGLRQSLMGVKARQRVRLVEKELSRLRAELPAARSV